jgi:putative transposase
VVGWSMATHLKTELVVDALQMAIVRRKPAPGLVHHSDRRVQYTSLSFGKKLEDEGLVPSMGRVGSAYDNALAESFLATLKTELLYRNTWPTRRAARTAIFEYIEGFYNMRRRHSALGYLSPAEFEEVRLEEENAASRECVYRTGASPTFRPRKCALALRRLRCREIVSYPRSNRISSEQLWKFGHHFS